MLCCTENTDGENTEVPVKGRRRDSNNLGQGGGGCAPVAVRTDTGFFDLGRLMLHAGTDPLPCLFRDVLK